MRISDWSSDVCSSDLYGIVKQSGGYIFADSVPGKGATFTIYLPVHAAGTAAVAAPRQEPKGDLWGSGTVLLVEDEDMVRAVAERALARQGYTVVRSEARRVGNEWVRTCRSRW